MRVWNRDLPNSKPSSFHSKHLLFLGRLSLTCLQQPGQQDTSERQGHCDLAQFIITISMHIKPCKLHNVNGLFSKITKKSVKFQPAPILNIYSFTESHSPTNRIIMHFLGKGFFWSTFSVKHTLSSLAKEGRSSTVNSKQTDKKQ